LNNQISERINGWAPIFRLITPTLVAIIGTIMISGQGRIEKEVLGLQMHFLNHLAHHQELEVGYERRITSIEGNRFTDKDAAKLEDRIISKSPPRWVVDKLLQLDRKTEVILEKIEKTTKR